MDLSRGYNLPPSAGSRLRLLDWIANNGGDSPGAIVDLGPLFDGRDERTALSIVGDLEALAHEELIGLEEALDWSGYLCVVRPPAVDLIEKVRAAREDLLERRKAARDAFLVWLHDCTLRGKRHPSIAEFQSSKYGSFYLRQFTEDEIQAATRWLQDEGYIKGTPVLSGGLASLSITTRGERVVESDKSVSDTPAAPVNIAPVVAKGSPMQTRREAGPIFVVHGRDHSVLHHAVRVLQQSTGREVIVLHEQPNAGRTILEKFEHHAGPASYAVVLLTGDDEGGLPGGPARSRGRQNVVFELGFFFGRLGRQKVAVLLGEDVEQPSDINGLVYIGLDPGGAWKHLLCRELAAAGIEVDHSKIP